MPRLVVRKASLLALLALAACGEDNLGRLVPELVAGDGSTADATGQAQYVVDFGEVPIGGNGLQTFYVRNDGRAPLALLPPALAAPFTTELVEQALVPMQEELGVVFLFTPTAEGKAEAIVTLDSDGGALTVRLTGRGRVPSPTDCKFEVTPAKLDFGVVAAGATKSLDVRVVNTGANACLVRQLKLGAGSDGAFSIVGGAVASYEITAFGDYTVSVEFKPTGAQTNYSGALTFAMGPPDAPVTVPLAAQGQGATPVATEKVYVNTSSTLYSWDPATKQLRPVGAFKLAGGIPVSAMTDIAIDSQGVMVGCDNSNRLYRIDPTSAKCTPAGKMQDRANGLTYVKGSNGREELIASGLGVWAIDLLSGAKSRTIVAAGGAYETSGDIVGLPDGNLYWAVCGAAKCVDSAGKMDRLVRLDPVSGSATVVGELNAIKTYGVGYANGELFAFTDAGKVLAVDPQNASALRTENVAGSWWGAATNPVTWGQ